MKLNFLKNLLMKKMMRMMKKQHLKEMVLLKKMMRMMRKLHQNVTDLLKAMMKMKMTKKKVEA